MADDKHSCVGQAQSRFILYPAKQSQTKLSLNDSTTNFCLYKFWLVATTTPERIKIQQPINQEENESFRFILSRVSMNSLDKYAYLAKANME